jgi:glycine/serine hydroxymethyltransferase
MNNTNNFINIRDEETKSYEINGISDTELISAMQGELCRQQNSIELIASENFVSEQVLNIQGSALSTYLQPP